MLLPYDGGQRCAAQRAHLPRYRPPGKLCDFEKVVLSAYVTDADGAQDCIDIQIDKQMVKNALQSGIEEADGRIIPHVATAIKDRLQRIIAQANKTDLLIWFLHYFSQYSLMGVKQLWIKDRLGR